MKLLFLAFSLSLLASACSSLPAFSTKNLSCRNIDADLSWGALSGLTTDIRIHNRLYAVHDQNLPRPEILVLDISGHQASITHSIPIRKNARPPVYDLEGIAHRQEGGFWVTSEGKTGRKLPNLIVRVDENGQVREEVPLPASITRHQVKTGLEGIAVTGKGKKERVTVAFQRSWKDDPKGQVKIGQYWPATGQWRFYRYPLDTPKGTGLSAITPLGNGLFAVLERDNNPFFKAKTKAIYQIELPRQPATTAGPPYPLLNKSLLMDLLPTYSLRCGTNGKLEGMTSGAGGELYLVADDDGKGNAMLLVYCVGMKDPFSESQCGQMQ